MCGRYVLAFGGDGLVHSYVATKHDRAGDWKPVYSIAPRTIAPVLREFFDDEGELQRSLELARWGLHPAWAKDKGPRPINARMETVATNGMFRGSFSSGRAVVPMTGYYEWVEAPDGGKDPFFIHHPEGELLHAAGLTVARKSEDGDGWDVTFTVVTREARDAGGEVHDRMPAFLTEEALADWLAPGKLEAEQKDPLLAQLEEISTTVAGQLVTVAVDRQVNNVRTLDRSDPTLIEPVTQT
ncbi:SOS response-associated peptidase [Brachybacterium paraconglomeratum]|uniref:SOS response-associated peptidase n=1 Tax=Brachybacterium paraconglomeratum TaxID=173362 RepID=UPI0022AF10A0|nr:SOS response-associated peptidase [Brachybacterium paraconglomeratum]MCZ4326755.1 SOS response-associated peptidase [Brachybacterium paraconglomeratum]